MQKRQEAQTTVIEQENTASVYEALCQKINLNAVDSVIDIEQFQSAEKCPKPLRMNVSQQRSAYF